MDTGIHNMPTIYYGWDVPSDDDYVKDTAAYMRTLGNDIDATLYTINTDSTPVGLKYLGTFSATNASLTVDNVFTTTYDNYKIVITGTASAITPMRFNMRTTAPASDTSAFYDYAAIRVNAGTGTVNSAYAAGNSNLFITDLFTARNFSATLELQSPRLAANTFINGFTNYVANTDFYVSNNSVRTTTQYAGFTVYQQSGNFTTITAKVYGYRN